MYDLLIPGLNLLATFLGTGLAGIITYFSIKQQIKYDRTNRQRYEEERYKKGFINLNWTFKQILEIVDHLNFFIKERQNASNIYEIDFLDEINERLQELNHLRMRLEQLDPDIFSVNAYRMINNFSGLIFNINLITKIIIRDVPYNEFQINKFNSDVALLKELYNEYLKLYKQNS
ncbi:hypothetical protein [Cytobacillus firmus]|uniref:hypothetical protein n=1 Tax=Cytobacillus firmus TaxID=1399 RepID=UPI001C8EA36E|nr:hypothetical protein [Cytobacillus firmus]MBX9972530.1 hypothetical protein [Cytobacillus firmus]